MEQKVEKWGQKCVFGLHPIAGVRFYSQKKIFHSLNGILRHTFLRVGEDIPLQHIMRPTLTYRPYLQAWACGNKGSKFKEGTFAAKENLHPPAKMRSV